MGNNDPGTGCYICIRCCKERLLYKRPPTPLHTHPHTHTHRNASAPHTTYTHAHTLVVCTRHLSKEQTYRIKPIKVERAVGEIGFRSSITVGQRITRKEDDLIRHGRHASQPAVATDAASKFQSHTHDRGPGGVPTLPGRGNLRCSMCEHGIGGAAAACAAVVRTSPGKRVGCVVQELNVGGRGRRRFVTCAGVLARVVRGDRSVRLYPVDTVVRDGMAPHDDRMTCQHTST